MENSISDLFKIIDQNLKEYVIVYDFIEDELIYVSSNIDNYSKNRKVEKLTDVLSLFLCEDDSKKFVESLMLRLKNYVDGDSTLSNMYKVQKFSKCESPKDNFEQLEIYSKIIEKEGAVYWFINILDISSHKKELQKKEDLIKELTESKRELHQVRSALIKRNQILNDLTIKDDLTGAYNRYYFDNIFREEIERNSPCKSIAVCIYPCVLYVTSFSLPPCKSIAVCIYPCVLYVTSFTPTL